MRHQARLGFVSPPSIPQWPCSSAAPPSPPSSFPSCPSPVLSHGSLSSFAPHPSSISRRTAACVLKLKSEMIRLEADGVAIYGSTASSIIKLESEVDKMCNTTTDKAHDAMRAVGNASFLICGVVVSTTVAFGVLCHLTVCVAGARATKSYACDHMDVKFTQVKIMLEKKIDDQHQGDVNMIRDAHMKFDSRAASIKAKEEDLRARQVAIKLKKTQGGATKHGEEEIVEGQVDQRLQGPFCWFQKSLDWDDLSL